MKGISVVLPAYLEEENLKRILPQLQEVLKDIEHEILVVDTMEPMDDTRSVCEMNDCRYVPRRVGNLYGDAIRTGIAEAQKEYLVVMDADGSHNPKDILRFYECMNEGNVDLIIGSRYCKGGNSHNGFVLKLMSKTLNLGYRLIFQLKVADVSDSFRMYHTEQVKELQLECDNFDLVEEILIRLQLSKKGFTIKEIPIYFNKREFGESKRDLVKFIFSYIKTMRSLYAIKKKAERPS